MLLEAAVLDGHHRLGQMCRQHVEGNVVARDAPLGKQRAIMPENANDGRAAILARHHRMRQHERVIGDGAR